MWPFSPDHWQALNVANAASGLNSRHKLNAIDFYGCICSLFSAGTKSTDFMDLSSSLCCRPCQMFRRALLVWKVGVFHCLFFFQKMKEFPLHALWLQPLLLLELLSHHWAALTVDGNVSGTITASQAGVHSQLSREVAFQRSSCRSCYGSSRGLDQELTSPNKSHWTPRPGDYKQENHSDSQCGFCKGSGLSNTSFMKRSHFTGDFLEYSTTFSLGNIEF